MADGSVKIDVRMNVSKAERELAKLKDKIQKTEKELNEASARKPVLLKEIAEVGAQLDEATEKVKELREQLRGARGSSKNAIKEELQDAVEEQRILTKEANRLNSEYDSVTKKIESATNQIAEMQEDAGGLAVEIEEGEAAEEKEEKAEALADAVDSAKGKFVSFIKTAVGIATVAALVKKLKEYTIEAVGEFAQYDEETRNSIQGIKDSLAQLKLSWGAAFAPILNAVAPLIQTLIGWLTSAANAVSRFIAILSGKSTYKKAVMNTEGVAGGMSDIAGAAGDAADGIKEVKKQLLGFDELNILSKDNSSTGSGSGGGVGGGGGSNFDVVEEAIDAFDGSFLSNLALSVKDVLFDWHDLNPEQIAQKAISGLSTLLGAGVGFMIAGVPGAIVGSLIGLTLSLIANSIIFDHDGVLSPKELGNTLEIALNGLSGGAIGFIVGGPAGALIGATIGVGFTLLGKSILPQLGAGSTANILSDLVDGLNKGAAGGAGAAIGFMIGGPGGAAIGGLIGLGLSFMITKMKAYNADGNDPSKYKDKMTWFLCGVLGLPTDEEWMGYGKQAIGWLGEGFSGFLDEIHNIIGGPLENLIEVEIPETVEFFKEIGPKALAFLSDGFGSFATTIDSIIFQPFRELWSGLSEWWGKLSLSPFHIPHPVIEWGTREATGAVAKVLNFFGLEPSMPTLSISWMAKGGIFDTPSLIGVGEAGKEAVVPLERNTEWMNLVADGIVDRLESTNRLASAIANVPRPAMVGGYVAPPNAYHGYGSNDTNLLEQLKNLEAAVIALANRPIDVDGKVYLDGKQLSDAVTKFQRRSAKSMG